GRWRRHFDLEQTADLELSGPLARHVHDLANLLERDGAALCYVERASLAKLPRLHVRVVQLDGPGLGVDVEVEVMPTPDERARALLIAALTAGGRARCRRLAQGIDQLLLADLAAQLGRADGSRPRVVAGVAPAFLARAHGRYRSPGENARDGPTDRI